MVYGIPVITRFCFCFPLHPGILIFGIIRLNVAVFMALLYVYFLIVRNVVVEIPLIITIIIEAVVLLDLTIIFYFLYGYNTSTSKKEEALNSTVFNNVKYLTKFFPFCICTLLIKAIVYCALGFFTLPILVSPYLICIALDTYMLILINTMMVQGRRAEGHCEFVNKLANPDIIVNIEVVDDSIPDMYKNRVYLVSDKYKRGDIVGKVNDNGEVMKKNCVSEDQKTEQKINNEQNMANSGQLQPIPPLTITHM